MQSGRHGDQLDGRAAALRRAWLDLPPNVRHEVVMSGNRMVAAAGMFLTFVLYGGELAQRWMPALLGWVVLAACIAGHLVVRRTESRLRKALALALDVGGTSILLYAGDAATAFLFSVYFWIIIGNGLRFGTRHILAAALLSFVGFVGVIVSTPFWAQQLPLSLGLLGGLVVLPPYMALLTGRLARARHAAEAAARAKILFLAGVSHELRTPLNAIVGTSELLRRTRLSGEQEDMLHTVSTAGNALLDMIGDLLEFSRIEAGVAPLHSGTFQLGQLLGEALRLITPQAQAKGLAINCYVTARTPLALQGDARRIREVLANLCGNAVKFTAAGSITVAADGWRDADGQVQLRLEVSDTGIGIAPEAQGRIFGLFTQADESVLDRFGGTGLGLALCQRQVTLMHGRIGVDSAPGLGSTFWIRLTLREAAEGQAAVPAFRLAPVSDDPLWRAGCLAGMGGMGTEDAAAPLIALVQQGTAAPPPGGVHAAVLVQDAVADGLPPAQARLGWVTALARDADAEAVANALRIAAQLRPPAQGTDDAMPEAAPVTPLRILVADDNRVNQQVTAKMLEHAGHVVVLAGNGEEALDVLSGEDVDVAFMDLNMPVINGFDAFAIYKSTAIGGPRVPVFALTADATDNTRRRCLGLGMAGCITKPFRQQALIEAIGAAVPPVAAPAGETALVATPSCPVVDEAKLAELEGIAGAPFVIEIIQIFLHDAQELVDEAVQALLDRDHARFRSCAHSLRGVAANTGAQTLYNLCKPWERLPEREFLQQAGSLTQQLRREWDVTRAEFERLGETRAGLAPHGMGMPGRTGLP